MKKPQLPPNEDERIGSLHALDILDTPAEACFDRITRITQALFDVPIVLISLVDEKRQWFKSRQGLTVCQTSRDISFCGHAILGPGVFWVEDALEDERFADNPQVIGPPHVRFYAASPLRDLDGNALGTLCIKDRKPRALNPVTAKQLADMGAVVESELAGLQVGSRRQDLRELRIHRQQRLDAVTGAWNLVGIQDALRHGLRHCESHGTAGTVVVAEADGCCADAAGTTRDEIDLRLLETAEALRSVIQPFDSIGRIEDGLFCLFLADVGSAEIDAKLDELRQAVERTPPAFGGPVQLRIGWVSTDQFPSAPDADAMLEMATAKLTTHA